MAAGLQPSNDQRASRVQAVLRAIADYDLTGSTAWGDLDALSTHTYVDDVEVDPEGIIFQADGSFRGAMSIYVLLRYGSRGDSMETSESFLGHFTGKLLSQDDAAIDDVKVDTSSFFR